LQDDPDVQNYLNHKYYDVVIRRNARDHWRDLEHTPNAVLSTVSLTDDWPPQLIHLNFKFPFYGHDHDSIFIDPNGFLELNAQFCGYSFCDWGSRAGGPSLYSRYLAPILTDWNPGFTNWSRVHYLQEQATKQDGSLEWRLTVQWSRITLWSETESYSEDTSFTFQVAIHEDGNIYFEYFHVPFDPTVTLCDCGFGTPTYYPVHMGLEDAVLVRDPDGYSYLTGYSPLNLNYSLISDPTGISVMFRAQLTCLDFFNCTSCIAYTDSHRGDPNRLQCGWCDDVQLCSDGVGREEPELSDACEETGGMITTSLQCTTSSVRCGVLYPPSHGTVTSTNGDKYRSVATYGCEVGFELNSTGIRTCGVNQKWNGTAPYCVKPSLEPGL
jgi:hypothetical protein